MVVDVQNDQGIQDQQVEEYKYVENECNDSVDKWVDGVFNIIVSGIFVFNNIFIVVFVLCIF